ncbi:MAG: S8 family serine peptidase [Pseudomonadota bacterium]
MKLLIILLFFSSAVTSFCFAENKINLPHAYWLRALPGESVEYKFTLAELALPLWVKTEEEKTLREHIIDTCGHLDEKLLSQLEVLAGKYNGISLLEQNISPGITLAIPFCNRVDGPKTVYLQKGSTISDVLQKYTGLYGSSSIRAQVAKDLDLPADQVDSVSVRRYSTSIMPGAPLSLDFTARQRLLLPQSGEFNEVLIAAITEGKVEGYSEGASASRLRAADPAYWTFRDSSITFGQANLFPDQSTTEISLDSHTVSLVEPVSLAKDENACGGIDGWKYFDAELFLERFLVERKVLEAGKRPIQTAIVGVIDSGLLGFGSWPFNENRFKQNAAEVGIGTHPGRSDDNNDFIDDVWGMNFVSRDGHLEPFASHQRVRIHGTQISSIVLGGEVVSSYDKAGQIAKSIIVNFGAREGNGLQSAMALNQAVRYLADRGADIVNLSLSTRTKLAYTDIFPRMLFVVAAGNDGKDLAGLRHYPALLGGVASNSNFITVGAIDRSNGRAEFSNYGQNVDIFAPGCGIPAWDERKFSEEFGTSLSAAHVTFIASWIKGLAGELMYPRKLKDRLLVSADYHHSMEFADPSNQWQSGLVLNPAKAISLTHSVLETASGLVYSDERNVAEQIGAYCADKSIRKELQNIVKFTPNIEIPGRKELWVRYIIRNRGQSTKLCPQSTTPQTLRFANKEFDLSEVRDFVLQEF